MRPAAVELQRLNEIVLQQRRIDFDKSFFDIVLAVKTGEIADGKKPGLRQRIGRHPAGLLAIFAAEGDET